MLFQYDQSLAAVSQMQIEVLQCKLNNSIKHKWNRFRKRLVAAALLATFPASAIPKMIKYPQAPTGSIADTQMPGFAITYASASLGARSYQSMERMPPLL